jgi:hypothetical protein
VVEQLGLQGEACQEIEQKLGQYMIRAYELPTEVGRFDTTSFSAHHEQIESEADSLLRYGHSKDKRPDLRQCKAPIDYSENLTHLQKSNKAKSTTAIRRQLLHWRSILQFINHQPCF